MKISFKKTASFALAGILAVSCFAGCSKNSDKDEQGRTIIEVANYPTADGPDKDSFDKNVDEFMKANPDVNVKKDTYTFSVDTFFSKAAGGQLPTVFSTAYTEVSTCTGSGYIREISKEAEKHGVGRDKINPRLLDGVVGTKDGDLYGIPAYSYALGLAFNSKVFKEAGLVDANGEFMMPKTWDEVVEFAVQIKEKTGKAGLIIPTTNHVGGWLFTPIAWSYGVNFMEQDKDGNWKATFDTPEMVEVLQFYKDLKWKYDVITSDVLIDNVGAAQKLAAGEGAMLLRAPDFMNLLPGMGVDVKDFGLFPMPAGPKRHVTLLGGSLYMIGKSATDDQVDASIRYIKTQTTPEMTEASKKSYITSMEANLETGKGVGLFALSNWAENTEFVKFKREWETEHANTDPKAVREYNKFVTGEAYNEIEIQAEEPMCAQELYAVIDKIVQEVLTNKNADCAKLVKDANADFQQNSLDHV